MSGGTYTAASYQDGYSLIHISPLNYLRAKTTVFDGIVCQINFEDSPNRNGVTRPDPGVVPQRADLRDVDNVSFRHGGRLQQKSELAPVGPGDQLGGEGLYIGVKVGASLPSSPPATS